MKNAAEIRGVLFDLDGTLLDTAPDIAAALNALRREEGLEPLPFDAIRTQVSHGAVAVTRLGFPQADEVEFERLRQRLLELYALALAVHTRLFPGFEKVLETLEARGVRWGIVTNKPRFLTEPLLERLALRTRSGAIVSGDTLEHRKPHPAPVVYAAKLLDIPPAQCVYVGDALRDIQAGRASGMRTLVAKFGYLGPQDRPEEWQADALLVSPEELLVWLEGPHRPPPAPSSEALLPLPPVRAGEPGRAVD